MTMLDQLQNLDDEEVATACIRILEGLQDHQPSVQVGAIVSLHRLMLEVFGLDVREEIERLEHLMSNVEGDGWDKKFAAVRAYIVGELKASLSA